MKKYFAVSLMLFFTSVESLAQAPATPPRRLTVAEYANTVEERSFRGCSTTSVLEGTGNPGRGARGTRPPARRTGVQR